MPTVNRHRNWGGDRFSISKPTLDDPTLVVCPTCRSKAFVLPVQEDTDAVRAVCPGCGFSRHSDGKRRSFAWYAETPGDGYFGLDLWLQTPCKGHSLWAFNKRHLDVLEAYIAANLRERKQDPSWGWSNNALTSRLPAWMTAARNRSAVLKALQVLREKA